MAKKSIIAREIKRKELVQKYYKKRKMLKTALKKAKGFVEKNKVEFALQKLPKNSSSTRAHNRCWKTGRARAVFRYFGLCRNAFRELAHAGNLAGVIKASW